MKMIFSSIAAIFLSLSTMALPGSLDDSFGDSGKIISDLYGLTDVGKTILIDANEKILISGSAATNNPYEGHFALARYNQDGSLDKTFDHDGKVITEKITDNKSVNGEIAGMALQSSGKIIGVGRGRYDLKNGLVVIRYLENGALDTTFGTDGTTFVADSEESLHPLALTTDKDENIIIAAAGHVNNEVSLFTILRFSADGGVDTSFGTHGKVTTAITSGFNVPRAVKVDNSNRIVAGGFNGKSQFAIARYLPNGTLDHDFGTKGIATVKFNKNGVDTLNALAIQSDDKIVVGGGVQVDSMGGMRMIDFGIARLKADGKLDETFNKTGTHIIHFVRRAASSLWALTIDGAGNIIAVGDAAAVKGLAVTRLRPDGTIDESFGDQGKQVVPFGGTCHWEGVTLQADDQKIVTLGYVWNGKHYDIGIVRLNN